MRYFLKLLAIPFLVSLSALIPVHARDWANIKASGVLIAGTEGTYFPFNYVENGTLKGYEIELTEALAQKLGLSLDWRIIPFDSLLPAIRKDRIDLAISSHAYTEERATLVDFAKPHACSSGQIVAKKGGALTLAALPDKLLGVKAVSSYAEAAKKLKGIRAIKSYRSDTDAFSALKADKIDAWIADRWIVQSMLDKAPNSGFVLGEHVWPERISIVLHKNNPELLNKINNALGQLESEGLLRKFAEKYKLKHIICEN